MPSSIKSTRCSRRWWQDAYLESSNEVAEVRDRVTAQATTQTGTTDGWIDELARYRKQIVGRQKKRFAKFDNDEYLLRCQGGIHRLGAV
jgi:hypothetical protein